MLVIWNQFIGLCCSEAVLRQLWVVGAAEKVCCAWLLASPGHLEFVQWEGA